MPSPYQGRRAWRGHLTARWQHRDPGNICKEPSQGRWVQRELFPEPCRGCCAAEAAAGGCCRHRKGVLCPVLAQLMGLRLVTGEKPVAKAKPVASFGVFLVHWKQAQPVRLVQRRAGRASFGAALSQDHALVVMLLSLLRPAQLQEGLHTPSGPGQLSLCHSSPALGPWDRSCSFSPWALPPPREPQAKGAADTHPHQPSATASVQSPGSLPAKALLVANKGFSGCCCCHVSSFLFPRASSGEMQLLSVVQGSYLVQCCSSDWASSRQLVALGSGCVVRAGLQFHPGS